MNFIPIKPKKMSAQIAEQIRSSILTATFSPGDKLPPERELAELFGVSRPSVRDALYVKLINCMRCGMCLPTCPTYKETFLETASPRGRVALIRKLQEGELDQSERLLEYLSLCLDCQACASACPCGVNAGELVAEFTCERKSDSGLGFMEDLILRKLVPHPDRLESSMAPMRMYQRSGLQKLVSTLGILKMFPRPLERMEGLLPPLPSRPLRQEINEITPAVGTERGTVGFFLGCVMSLIFSDASRATIKAALLSRLQGHHPAQPGLLRRAQHVGRRSGWFERSRPHQYRYFSRL